MGHRIKKKQFSRESFIVLATNHREEHFETLYRLQCVRHSSRHDEHFAGFGMVHHSADGDFGFAIENGDSGIERSCVF